MHNEGVKSVVVVGHINLETTVAIEGFPLAYNPVNYRFFGIESQVAGVGYNLALALHTLGTQVKLLSLIGPDPSGDLVKQALQLQGLATQGVLTQASQTGQAVILYDPSGQRQIHTDLKDLQDQCYPVHSFRQAAQGANLAVLGNINYSRGLIPIALELGLPIATDVHTISHLNDAYNHDYMAAAQVLFQSHERLSVSPQEWVRLVQKQYGPKVMGVGLGSQGALLGLPSGSMLHIPAQPLRPIVNTIGAGDALFAAFLHFFLKTEDPLVSMRYAVAFAGYKIGARGAAQGFLSEEHLLQLIR